MLADLGCRWGCTGLGAMHCINCANQAKSAVAMPDEVAVGAVDWLYKVLHAQYGG